LDPLVSVIVSFFNAERFLQDAVESVFNQHYDAWELILVDDGSTDRSAEIALGYVKRKPGQVRYIHHEGNENRGLSASRNLGIREARGDYIAFLDADDVWLAEKLNVQVSILENNQEAAMVFEPALWWYSWTGHQADVKLDDIQALGIPLNRLVIPPTLLLLLLSHEGTQPATCSIMVRRRALERVGGFEDIFRDMYEDQIFCVKMFLQEQVYVGGGFYSKYRQRSDSIYYTAISTGKHPSARLRFLKWVEQYLTQNHVTDPRIWRVLKRELLLWRILSVHPLLEKVTEGFLATRRFWVWVRSHARVRILRGRFHLGYGLRPLNYSPSHELHQSYVERFLNEFATSIRGRCLEFQGDRYAQRFGGSAVTEVELVQMNASSPEKDFTASLSAQFGTKSNLFDTIICVDVLNSILDLNRIISMLHTYLRPNGTLLVTAPYVRQYDPDERDFWRFTPVALQQILSRSFGEQNVTIRTYGNSLIAAGEMRGTVPDDFTTAELEYSDMRCPIEICARAVK
jgi:glycosyltransferase involved in cell wall biosynthesis